MIEYSRTPLVRPLLVHQKSGLSEGWPLVRGRNQCIYRGKKITCPGARDKLNFRQDKHIFSPNVRRTSKKLNASIFFLDKDKLFGNRKSKNFDAFARGTSGKFQIFLPLIYIYIFIVKWPFQRGWPLVRVASQKGFHCTFKVFAFDRFDPDRSRQEQLAVHRLAQRKGKSVKITPEHGGNVKDKRSRVELQLDLTSEVIRKHVHEREVSSNVWCINFEYILNDFHFNVLCIISLRFTHF